MPNVSLVGIDTAGGVIVGPGTGKLTSDGNRVSLLGDSVASHGEPPHSSAVIVQGSNKLFVGGVPVTYAGCMASCGHSATGSSKITVSS